MFSIYVSFLKKTNLIGQAKYNMSEKGFCGVMNIQTLNLNNLWQCETTQPTVIIKFSAFGKLSYIKFLSIRINQMNLKLSFCVVLLSNLAFYSEFYHEIFDFEFQNKKSLCKIQYKTPFYYIAQHKNSLYDPPDWFWLTKIDTKV